MKSTTIVVALAAAAFVAGVLVSCSPSVGQAPDPVQPVEMPQGSYTTGTK